jgi:hypothetical protein
MRRRKSSVRTGIFILALSGSGCMLNPEVFGYGSGATPLAGEDFVIEIEPSRVSALGGASSPALKDFVERELARKGMCKNGYSILGEGTGRGYYYVKGQCR